MLEARYGQAFQRVLLQPLATRLATVPRISANAVTLLACLMGVLVLPAVLLGWVWAAIGLLLFSGYLDALDGVIARHRAENSPKGACLDILSDRLVESTILLSLFLYAPAERGLLCLLMFAAILLCVTSFLVVGVFTEQENHKSFYYSPGLIERAEAFAFFVLMLALPQYFTLLAVCFSSLVLYTAVRRLVDFLKIPTILSY